MKILSKEHLRTASHYWLRAFYGKANKCECETCNHKSKVFDWALIHEKEYDCKRENFIMLCRSCHVKYDMTDERKLNISKSKSGKNHPLYGTHCSEETKLKLSIACSGENSGMYGKENKWGKHTEETKQKISETFIKNGINSGKNNPMYKKTSPNKGKKSSKETKLKISKSCKEYWIRKKSLNDKIIK